MAIDYLLLIIEYLPITRIENQVSGIELDDIKGSKYVTEAVGILRESRSKESP